jgi:hypothetical protein
MMLEIHKVLSGVDQAQEYQRENKKMKCNKAATGMASTLVFLVVSIIVMTGMSLTNVMMVNRVASIEIIDDGTSATMLAEGIVNMPDCLLYVEEIDGELRYTKDIIDWEKIEGKTNYPVYCPRKGAYLYYLTVTDNRVGDSVDLTDAYVDDGMLASWTTTVKDNPNAVMQVVQKAVGIKRGDNINPGVVEVNVYLQYTGGSELEEMRILWEEQ